MTTETGLGRLGQRRPTPTALRPTPRRPTPTALPPTPRTPDDWSRSVHDCTEAERRRTGIGDTWLTLLHWRRR